MFLGQTVLVCQSYMAGIGHCLYKREKNMHREIQIKQFPIVTTHWWPKTRNERFVWENEQYLYNFLPLVHNHVQVIWVRTRIRCVTCVRARSGSRCIHTGRRRSNAWRRACLKRGADTTFQAPTEASANQIASCKYPIPFKQHQRSMWLVVVTMTAHQHHASDTPSVKRWRRRPVWMQREPERAHTHVTHRMRVRTQITWTWLCTRGKKLYKYCSFSHTNRSFRVLGHQCVVTMGNCLIWISLCMFFFPLIERDSDLYLPLYDWQTRTVWPKNIKIGSTEEKKTPTSWMPLG